MRVIQINLNTFECFPWINISVFLVIWHLVSSSFPPIFTSHHKKKLCPRKRQCVTQWKLNTLSAEFLCSFLLTSINRCLRGSICLAKCLRIFLWPAGPLLLPPPGHCSTRELTSNGGIRSPRRRGLAQEERVPFTWAFVILVQNSSSYSPARSLPLFFPRLPDCSRSYSCQTRVRVIS